MINIDKKILSKEIKSRLLVQIHDELLLETKDTDLKKEIQKIKNEMENPSARGRRGVEVMGGTIYSSPLLPMASTGQPSMAS